jgi:hypothetical protein
MSSGILRSRIASVVSKHYRRLLSSDAGSGAPKEPLAPPIATSTATASASASSNTTTNATAASNASPSAVEANATSSNKGLRFLKYGIIGAVTGATAYAGYASYGLFSHFLQLIRYRFLFWAFAFDPEDGYNIDDRIDSLIIWILIILNYALVLNEKDKKIVIEWGGVVVISKGSFG